MTRLTLADRIFVKLAAVVFVAAFTVVPARADGPQDLEIMVNGPWSFVVYADPSLYGGDDRLYLVAPADVTHFASIWFDPNASMGNWMTLLQKHDPTLRLICPGGPTTERDQSDCKDSNSKQYLYLVDFDPTKPNAVVAPGEEVEAPYAEKIRITTNAIGALLSAPGSSRYAISLPMPDNIHTYSGDFGPGVTEVRLETGKNPTLGTPIATYATWTVLHYDRQNANQVNVTTKKSGDATPLNFPPRAVADRAGSTQPITRYGISISLMEAPLCKSSMPNNLEYYPRDCQTDTAFLPVPGDDQQCDSLSGLSFAQSATFWGLPEHLLFPSEQDKRGTQSPWNYDFACYVSDGANLSKLQSKQQEVANSNLVLYRRAKDFSDKISLMKQRLGYGPGRASQRPKKKGAQGRSETSSLAKQFEEISSALDSLFQGKVPSDLSDSLACVCSIETPGKCQARGSSLPECDKANPKADFERFEELATQNLYAQDKGSSDCHAPQVSIDGAIQ
ncbi:MAG: hypothetical protein WBX38_07810 [Candidatus Sulfotelmatobacter sp.]